MLKAIWAQAHDVTGRPVIGAQGDMPWHLPEDLQYFKTVTSGAPVVMGRNTWESFPAQFRPLPGRTNVVITSAPAVEGADAVVESLREALEAARTANPDGDVWVIGGGRVYAEAMPHLDQLLVTEIDLEVTGDTFAPTIDPEAWAVTSEGPWQTSRTDLRYRFMVYSRR